MRGARPIAVATGVTCGPRVYQLDWQLMQLEALPAPESAGAKAVGEQTGPTRRGGGRAGGLAVPGLGRPSG